MELTVRPLDVVAIAMYLLAMLAVGAYFARRNKTTEEYFVGNRSFSGWVLGLSMLGTIVSSATFLALPAAAYALDWRQLSVNLMMPVVAIIAVAVFIPFFRRGGLTSAFEYLGRRFGTIPRLYGTISFTVLQLIRMAQILFLVALPIQFITGLPIEWVVIGTGILIAAYTIAGGIEAVIWTDVVQAIVMLFGGVLCVVCVVVDLPGGMSQILKVGIDQEKFSIGSFDWDLSQRTFWTVLALGVINWLGIYSGDQNMVQRYAAARTTWEARKATLVFSAIALPMWAMFFFVGTAVFVLYSVRPDPAIADLEADQVLPYFILTSLPVGVAGLLVAAVISAAMSSLDSGINSISTVVVVDLLRPFLAKGRSDRFYLKAARLIAVGVAIIMILGAITFSRIEKESMNDVSLIVTSVFGGCLMGLFMVGFFTRRVDGFSATVALILAVLFNSYLGMELLGWLPQNLRIGMHSYWVGALVNAFFIVLAYGISLFRGRGGTPPPDLEGLTISSMPKEPS